MRHIAYVSATQCIDTSAEILADEVILRKVPILCKQYKVDGICEGSLFWSEHDLHINLCHFVILNAYRVENLSKSLYWFMYAISPVYVRWVVSIRYGWIWKFR